MATGPTPVSAREFADLHEACKHWGRWGADDQRGALNFIAPDQVRDATASVSSGRTVACSWPLDTKAGPDNPKPVVHHMTMLQDVHIGDAGDLRFTCDFMGIEFHGVAHSHIDALCHVAYKGLLYNGVPVDRAVSSAGASMQTIDVAKDGIVGRGVLLDIPRLRGEAWVEPGGAVGRGEVESGVPRDRDAAVPRARHRGDRLRRRRRDGAEQLRGGDVPHPCDRGERDGAVLS